MPSFVLQKKRRLQFDESDDEGMMDLLKVTTTPPCSPVEHPSIVEGNRVGSSNHVAGARVTSPVLEAIEEIAGTSSVMSIGLSTTVLLPKDKVEAVTPPTLKDVELEFSPGVEREDVVLHLPGADGARIVGGVCSSRAAAQSLKVSLG